MRFFRQERVQRAIVVEPNIMFLYKTEELRSRGSSVYNVFILIYIYKRKVFLTETFLYIVIIIYIIYIKRRGFLPEPLLYILILTNKYK